jgi:hypothetical protein
MNSFQYCVRVQGKSDQGELGIGLVLQLTETVLESCFSL